MVVSAHPYTDVVVFFNVIKQKITVLPGAGRRQIQKTRLSVPPYFIFTFQFEFVGVLFDISSIWSSFFSDRTSERKRYYANAIGIRASPL